MWLVEDGIQRNYNLTNYVANAETTLAGRAPAERSTLLGALKQPRLQSSLCVPLVLSLSLGGVGVFQTF